MDTKGIFINLNANDWQWLKDDARVNNTNASAIVRHLIAIYREAVEAYNDDKAADEQVWLINEECNARD
jgi:hypothetical protein